MRHRRRGGIAALLGAALAMGAIGCGSSSSTPDGGSLSDGAVTADGPAGTDGGVGGDRGATGDRGPATEGGPTADKGAPSPDGGGGPAPTKIDQVAAGKSFTCVIFDTKEVRCWGYNSSGQLGYATTVSGIGHQSTPKQYGKMVKIGGKVTQLALGDAHACALLDTGKVRCWGGGALGRLGYGNTNNVGLTNHPADVGDVDLGGAVKQLSAGANHTCALMTDAKVRCWGECAWGQCGIPGQVAAGPIGDNEKPSAVAPMEVGVDVEKVAAGGQHTCLLLKGGKVRCFGEGEWGRLGYGDQLDIKEKKPSELKDVDVGGEVVDLQAGNYNTCALIKGGALRCWGAGNLGVTANAGQHVGDNEAPSAVAAIKVGALVTSFSISSTGSHICAVTDAQNLRCWGSGQTGKLGYAAIADIHDPSAKGDVKVGETVLGVAAGGNHSCALTSKNQVRCWGSASAAQLGYGNATTIGDTETPDTAGDVPVF